LNAIHHQAYLARAVSVQESHIGIEASENQAALHLGIEDAIAIVEQHIEVIRRALRLAPRPPQAVRDDTADRLPITRRGPSLHREQQVTNLTDRTRWNPACLIHRVTQ